MTVRIHSFISVKRGFPALLLALALLSQGFNARAQNAPEPRREELLNGLHVLIWSQPASQNVSLRLRINSGSTFDLAGKSGQMALLADLLFPDAETREFFTEELGGSLEVSTDYDGINIRMSGRASDFERMLEFLRIALVNTPLTNDNVVRLREARIKMVRELGIAPAFIADRLISKRLFGEYPYGRPLAGTPDSLARVERADLLLARERFLTPDNSTLVVIGGVQEARAMRALRQLLGTWRKSDKLVPATFRQPDAPDTRTLILDLPGTESVEVRLAARTLPRSDKDYAAAALITLIARDRWQTALPELGKAPFFVRHEPHQLSGMFVMGATVRATEAAQALETARAVLRALVETPVTAAELERAKSEATAVINKASGDVNAVADAWLDAESFRLDLNANQTRAFNKLTPADLQRVAARLFRDASFATVAVGSAAQFKSELERAGKVEMLTPETQA
ncbi:MAG: insulinase family protein, partial [Acidobacteria bacterium]|nr:insulinase family protein [Acidobacteriota bacterium]